MMDKKKCGEYIRRKREEAGLSRAELAAKLGVGSYEVEGWETGFFPPVEMILPLAEALGVEAEDILAGEDGAGDRARARSEKRAEKTGDPQAEKGPLAETPEKARASQGSAPAALAPSAGEPAGSEAEEAAKAEKAGKASGSLEPGGQPPESRGPAASPGVKEKGEKQNSRYFRKQSGNVVRAAPAPLVLPSGKDGFSASERLLGSIVCIVFIAAVLISRGTQLIGWLGRERVLTTENYREYIDISVEPTDAVNGAVFNPDRYTVFVSSKRGEIQDFSILIEVTFTDLNSLGGDEEQIYRTVVMNGRYFSSGREVLSFDTYVLESGVKVKSVEGRLP